MRTGFLSVITLSSVFLVSVGASAAASLLKGSHLGTRMGLMPLPAQGGERFEYVRASERRV